MAEPTPEQPTTPEGPGWSNTLPLSSRPFGSATTPAQLALGQPSRSERRRVPLYAAGVLVVIALLVAALWWQRGAQDRARAAREAAAAAEAASAAEAQADAERRAAEEAEQRRQAQARAEDEERRRRAAERERIEAQTRQAAIHEAALETAFTAQYRPPPGCRDSSSVPCVNAYIRARRAFEVRYRASAPAP